MKSVRTALVIASIALVGGFSASAFAQTTPAPKHAKSACAEHVKAMKGMKTAAERESYCKEHEDCMANKCMAKMGKHKGAMKKKSAAPAAPKEPAN